MTKRRAESIIGAEINIIDISGKIAGKATTNGKLFGAGVRPVGYKAHLVIAMGATEEKALENVVREHYKWISEQVRREQGFRCGASGDSFGCGSMVPLEIDHIVMRSKGRDDSRGNLRALCVDCHRGRHGG